MMAFKISDLVILLVIKICFLERKHNVCFNVTTAEM